MINQNKRKVGYLLIGLAIILLVLAIIFFLSPEKNVLKNLFDRNEKSSEEKTAEELFEEMKAQKEAEIVYSFDPEFESNRDWDEDDFKQIARSFVERFGSYSNQSDYGNIDDLKMFMTAKMKLWADEYVSDLKSEDLDQDKFYGIITKALIEPEVLNFDLASSKVDLMVATQREETTDSQNKRVFSQNIKISFVKENGEWLVDGAFWQ
ncbi:MAG: hypothetical protein PHP37_03285 [Patescibacteria group bacterium]|nr:hypothetical protein [Patescibacteria group bacterium]